MEQLGVWLFCIGLGICLSAPIFDALTRIAQGIEYMADLESQALADLSAAVSNVGAQIAAGVAALQAALAGSVPPIDHSPAIEAAVASLNTAAATLKAAVPAPVAAPVAAAPAAPAAVTPAA